MQSNANLKRRQLVVVLLGIIFMAAAYAMLSYPHQLGLSPEGSIWGGLIAAILAPVSITVGARWIRAARPEALNPEELSVRRTQGVGRVRLIVAVVLGIACAIATPLYLPEAQSLSWPLAALAGAAVGTLTGLVVGHLFASGMWAMLMPRTKR